MRKGRLIEEIWMRQIESYIEADKHVKVADRMDICLTNMSDYSAYGYLGLELENLLTTLDEIDLNVNTMTMGALSHTYNKIKYTVLEAAQKSLTNTVNIDGTSIRNVQILEELDNINFIFTLAYVDILQGLPLVLYAALRIIEHVCEGCMVSTEKDINLFVNIGYGHLELKHLDRARIITQSRQEELYGGECGEDMC